MVRYHSLAAKFQSLIAVSPKNIESNNPTNNIYFIYFNLLTQAFNMSYDRSEDHKANVCLGFNPSDCTR